MNRPRSYWQAGISREWYRVSAIAGFCGTTPSGTAGISGPTLVDTPGAPGTAGNIAVGAGMAGAAGIVGTVGAAGITGMFGVCTALGETNTGVGAPGTAIGAAVNGTLDGTPTSISLVPDAIAGNPGTPPGGPAANA